MYCKKLDIVARKERVSNYNSNQVVSIPSYSRKSYTDMMNCNCPTFNLCNMTKIWCISLVYIIQIYTHTYIHSRDWIKFTVNKFWIRSNFVYASLVMMHRHQLYWLFHFKTIQYDILFCVMCIGIFSSLVLWFIFKLLSVSYNHNNRISCFNTW